MKKKPIPRWYVDWWMNYIPRKTEFTENGGVISYWLTPQEMVQWVDDWFRDHPDLAAIPRLAKAQNDMRDAALQAIREGKSGIESNGSR